MVIVNPLFREAYDYVEKHGNTVWTSGLTNYKATGIVVEYILVWAVNIKFVRKLPVNIHILAKILLKEKNKTGFYCIFNDKCYVYYGNNLDCVPTGLKDYCMVYITHNMKIVESPALKSAYKL